MDWYARASGRAHAAARRGNGDSTWMYWPGTTYFSATAPVSTNSRCICGISGRLRSWRLPLPPHLSPLLLGPHLRHHSIRHACDAGGNDTKPTSDAHSGHQPRTRGAVESFQWSEAHPFGSGFAVDDLCWLPLDWVTPRSAYLQCPPAVTTRQASEISNQHTGIDAMLKSWPHQTEPQ